jgi:hypothetical protein
MKVYKIKHKPTGLFFTPSKGYGNLSVKGKVYESRPSMKWIGNSIRIVIRKWKDEKINRKEQIIIDYFKLERNKLEHFWIDSYFPVEQEDWEIVEL